MEYAINAVMVPTWRPPVSMRPAETHVIQIERPYMMIMSIGVIDIKAMFGIGAVSLSKSIDLVIELVSWDKTRNLDRIGIEENTISILNVEIPYQTMPIRPGRNLAILVEVAARNLSLKKTGYNAARELIAASME